MEKNNGKAVNTADKSDKLKALDAALSKIEKDFGKGSVMKLGDKGSSMDCRDCADRRSEP